MKYSNYLIIIISIFFIGCTNNEKEILALKEVEKFYNCKITLEKGNFKQKGLNTINNFGKSSESLKYIKLNLCEIEIPKDIDSGWVATNAAAIFYKNFPVYNNEYHAVKVGIPNSNHGFNGHYSSIDLDNINRQYIYLVIKGMRFLKNQNYHELINLLDPKYRKDDSLAQDFEKYMKSKDEKYGSINNIQIVAINGDRTVSKEAVIIYIGKIERNSNHIEYFKMIAYNKLNNDYFARVEFD